MAKILDKINGPEDVKPLSYPELGLLAGEIRRRLITIVSQTGGHLASNLGVVELSIALHRIFNSPRDKIVWDVGHQSYVHKMLTGRRAEMPTLRQYGGLSGYTSRDESVHDPFGAGHASTSVSAALGMALARDMAGDDYHVIAVIGDGAVTGGMSLEALNHAGHLGNKLIIILNDNGMSISPTVGALARRLDKMRFDYRYRVAKEKSRRLIYAFPWGKKFWGLVDRLKDSLRNAVIPSSFWEQLGLTYIGPVDGHDIAGMEKALLQARDQAQRPALVHVITTKGKGYSPAEENAVYFHGVAPANGHRSTPTYSEIFARTVLKMARKNPKLIAITPAMPEGNELSIVADEFPERVIDVGICEQHAVTFAAGLATQGFMPVVAIYSTFLQRAFDQIIHDVCLQNIPVVFAIDRAGIVGDDGKTHQGAFDISYLSLIPNLVVAAPKDENELQHLLYTAVQAKQPMAVRYPRSAGVGVKLDDTLRTIRIGSGEKLRDGDDVAILAIGNRVTPSLNAAETLAGEGIGATVINARFAKPLDEALILDAARKVKKLVTVEENALNGGFGSMVATLLKREGLTDIALRNLGLADEFVEAGPQPVLREKYGIDEAGIAGAVRDLLNIKRDEKLPSSSTPK
jgi:1-deoxy-D-xylulose-5-phosphate synthase